MQQEMKVVTFDISYDFKSASIAVRKRESEESTRSVAQVRIETTFTDAEIKHDAELRKQIVASTKQALSEALVALESHPW